MSYFNRFLALISIFVFGVSACSASGSAASTTPNVTNSTGTTIPAATSVVPVSAPKAAMPPQTNAAGIQPPERRQELTRLSSLLKFKVIGRDGAALGQVSDFIINTCETYIIYFAVIPDGALKVASGNNLVIPFEVVTINSGVLNASDHSISLFMTPAQVAAAPAFADHLALFPNTWEDTVRAYWLQQARVSHLTSECKAGGSNSANAVHKIAYASQLIGAQLKDGNAILLGTIEDAILEPESGKLGFYVVKLLDGSLVMVPLGQTNIPKAALEPGKTIELVLLADNNKLLGAPHIANVEKAMLTQTQATARGYWKK